MLKFGTALLLVTVCLSMEAAGASRQFYPSPKGCKFTDASRKEFSCTITKLSDCNNLLNTPYDRNLLCPSAYGVAYTMRKRVAKLLGQEAKTTGSFLYYQTIPDVGKVPAGVESQTTIPCMATPHPWNATDSIGVGLPLCSLLARAASFNTRPRPSGGYPEDKLNPVTSANQYTNYHKKLIFMDPFSDVGNFGENSEWDPIVKRLGSSGGNVFSKMEPSFQDGAAYNPWNLATPPYFGISGGGGEGWGAEIAIDNSTLLEFGGGGGAGMTSYTGNSSVIPSRVGAAGGGGVNIGSGYTRNGINYNGLGLGAGADYKTDTATYSYYAAGSTGDGQPVYNATTVNQYITEMELLHAQLKQSCAAGKTVVFQGGGGAGAGAEFLQSNGSEYAPHAISTQGGFQFSYRITCNKQRAAAAVMPVGLYVELGRLYSQAIVMAKASCGGWSDYSCICRTSNAYLVAVLKEKYNVLPAWLNSSTCPSGPLSPAPSPAPTA